MSLLNKFDTVKVDNTKRVPSDDMDILNSYHTEYIKVLKINKEVLSNLEPLCEITNPLRKSTTQKYNTYVTNVDDMLGTVKKEISNLHYMFLSNAISYFTKKYNIDIDYEKEFTIQGRELGKLYVHKWYDYFRPNGNVFTWDIVKELEFSTQDVIDFVFSKTDSRSLSDVVFEESISYLIDWNKSEYPDDITTTKNGIMTMDYYLVNPTSHYNDKTNTKALVSLITCLDKFLVSKGSSLPDGVEINSLKKYFEIGTYYSSWNRDTKMYDKLEFDGELLHYFHYFKNGKLKIKFKNQHYTHEFMKFVGLE